MSDTCRLFPPFGDPWPSCLLPSHFHRLQSPGPGLQRLWKVCPFFLLKNSRPLSPWGPLDFLSTCLGNDSLKMSVIIHPGAPSQRRIQNWSSATWQSSLSAGKSSSSPVSWPSFLSFGKGQDYWGASLVSSDLDSMLPMQRMRVQSLVRGLISHMLCDQKEMIKNKQKTTNSLMDF
jgi:hypothetical protein